MLFKEAISNRILGLMEEYKFTRNSLAEKSAVPSTTVFDIINCNVENPSSFIIWQLCKGFGISLKEFYDHDLFKKENILD